MIWSVCFILFTTTIQIGSISTQDLKSIFHIPSRRNYDDLEILERSNFEDGSTPSTTVAPVTDTPIRAYANAQVLLRFGGDSEKGKCACGDVCQCKKEPYYVPVLTPLPYCLCAPPHYYGPPSIPPPPKQHVSYCYIPPTMSQLAPPAPKETLSYAPPSIPPPPKQHVSYCYIPPTMPQFTPPTPKETLSYAPPSTPPPPKQHVSYYYIPPTMPHLAPPTPKENLSCAPPSTPLSPNQHLSYYYVPPTVPELAPPTTKETMSYHYTPPTVPDSTSSPPKETLSYYYVPLTNPDSTPPPPAENLSYNYAPPTQSDSTPPTPTEQKVEKNGQNGNVVDENEPQNSEIKNDNHPQILKTVVLPEDTIKPSPDDDINKVKCLEEVSNKLEPNELSANLKIVNLDLDKLASKSSKQKLEECLLPYSLPKQKPKLLVSYPIFNRPNEVLVPVKPPVVQYSHSGYSLSGGEGYYSDPVRSVVYRRPTVLSIVPPQTSIVAGGGGGRYIFVPMVHPGAVAPVQAPMVSMPHNDGCCCCSCAKYSGELNEKVQAR